MTHYHVSENTLLIEEEWIRPINQSIKIYWNAPVHPGHFYNVHRPGHCSICRCGLWWPFVRAYLGRVSSGYFSFRLLARRVICRPSGRLDLIHLVSSPDHPVIPLPPPPSVVILVPYPRYSESLVDRSGSVGVAPRLPGRPAPNH